MAERISEYRGPLRLGPSSIGEGEGLFATQDLAVGTVLLVCKPFAGLYVKSKDTKAFSENASPHEYLVGTMANKIWLDPQLGREIYTLWAGPELKSLKDDDPKITKVDIDRITKIYHANFARADADAFISCGVWIPPSKINHSCVDANVMIGHHETSLVMTVTTFKEVKNGDEIVASYVDPVRPFPERNFMESHGFICRCRLCELERSESAAVSLQRERLLRSLTVNPDRYLSMYFLRLDLQTITALKDLRAASPDLNFALTHSEMSKIVATVLLRGERCEPCFLLLETIYSVIGNIPPNYVAHAYAETILICCMKLGKEKAVLEKWVEEVRKYCRLYAECGTCSGRKLPNNSGGFENIWD
ncbi:uncharacterized protein LOC110854505 [Folsomia candida]|uniref:uncharacterized protein LOC110854505 n=1 Tax=Folsomia candida TaxID=158441 RepID=UPI001604DECD|nr:uncharacterized protein LOC110854505 [Folsomia candida]